VLTNEVHKVLEHGFEMCVAWNRNCNVDSGSHGGPNESGHSLCPSSTKDLNCETDRVNVWAVVRDDTQAQYDEAELAEAAQGAEKYCAQETSSARCGISIRVLVLAVVECGGSHDSDAKHLGEE
jgi:hypothetical protein